MIVKTVIQNKMSGITQRQHRTIYLTFTEQGSTLAVRINIFILAVDP